jgi:hypothetical protein
MIEVNPVHGFHGLGLLHEIVTPLYLSFMPVHALSVFVVLFSGIPSKWSQVLI